MRELLWQKAVTGSKANSESWVLVLLVSLLIFSGLYLRFTLYSENHSLWLDEAVVAEQARDPAQLLSMGGEHLLAQYRTSALGFLTVVSALVKSLGDQEWVLRLLPFIAGTLSIGLFYALTSRFLTSPYAEVGLALISLSTPLVHYSTEAKAYAVDVLISLVLLHLTFYCIDNAQQKRARGLLLLFCAVSPWLSIPVIFVIAGITSFLVVKPFTLRRNFILACAVLACLSTFGQYLVYLKPAVSNSELQRTWRHSYLGGGIVHSGLRDNFTCVYRYTFGIAFPGHLIILSVLGFLLLAFRHKARAALLIMPMVWTWAASLLKFYPFCERVTLFLWPILAISVVAGLEAILTPFRPLWVKWVLSFAITALLLLPTLPKLQHDYQFHAKDELRPLLQKVASRCRPSDDVYVYPWARVAFQYYARKISGLPKSPPSLALGPQFGERAFDEREKRQALAPLLSRPRAWFIVAHELGGWHAVKLFTDILDGWGKRAEEYHEEAATAILYEFPPRS